MMSMMNVRTNSYATTEIRLENGSVWPCLFVSKHTYDKSNTAESLDRIKVSTGLHV